MNQRKTLLAVDDTKENLEILIELLSEKYDVMVALDAQRGLEIVKEESVDIILLDIMMPEMDGYMMCSLLKQEKESADIPIIFLTAKTDEESIARAYDVGGVDYVSKPFQPKELIARVATHLKMRDLVVNLETMVATETEKCVAQERLLMQQSRLAAIGEMMDVIAHQWMQPISTINSQIALLGIDVQLKKIDEAYVKKLQTKFKKQIQHMTETLQEFRNFFRPSKNSVDFDARSMVANALHLVHDEFYNENICIKLQEQGSFFLHGIENEFIHMMLNIFNNAKDAFNERKITQKRLTISFRESEQGKIIEIVDNAGGIPEEIMDDIFKMNVTSKGEKGTGVGLYISSLIAQKHNGTLRAENSTSGAKFTFVQALEGIEKI